MYTLDTNAIIYYLKGEPRTLPTLRKIFGLEAPLFVSTISLIELIGYPNLTSFERLGIETLLQSLNIIPLDFSIARLAGELRNLYHLKTPDAAIAATAIYTNTPLVTRNIQDFKKIPNLKLLKI